MASKSGKAKYVLTYFNGKGRAETIRLVFAAAGISYEDKRIAQTDWPALKPNTPWGGVPILEVDGKVIGQSISIARFVAREGGLAGKTSVEQAQVDAAVDAITDLREKAIELHFAPDAQKETLGKNFQEKLPTILGNLQKLIGGNSYLVGDKLSLADLHFYAVAEAIVGSAPNALKAHPKLDQLYQKVASNAKVAEYLKKRAVTPF